MSSHNAETVTLTQISQKGTIIEPKRTLTFPIPSSLSDWTHLRFGIAISLTDLTENEASLSSLGSNTTSTDNTIATYPWFGLTNSANGVLPTISGIRYVGVGQIALFFDDEKSKGATMLTGSNCNRFNPRDSALSNSGSNNFCYVHLNGSSIIEDSGTLFDPTGYKLAVLPNHRSQDVSLLMMEFEIRNKGLSNQRIIVRSGPLGNTDSSPKAIAYSSFDKNSFVDGIATMHSIFSDNNFQIDFFEDSAAVPIPQNIIFHWPFYDQWRLRLHGAVLINKAP